MIFLIKLTNQESRNKASKSTGHGHSALWVYKTKYRNYIKNYLKNNKPKWEPYKNNNSKSSKFPWKLKINMKINLKDVISFLNIMVSELENQTIDIYKKKEPDFEIRKSLNSLKNLPKDDFIISEAYIEPSKFDSSRNYQFRVDFHKKYVWKSIVPYLGRIIIQHDSNTDEWTYSPKIILKDIKTNPFLNQDNVKSASSNRPYQSKYRKELLKLWNNKCALTGIKLPYIIEACHLKSDSFIKKNQDENNMQRQDPYNGIIMLNLFHKLFDLGYFTFDPSGEIKFSEYFKSTHNQSFLKIQKMIIHKKIKIQKKSLPYISHHNKIIFLGNEYLNN